MGRDSEAEVFLIRPNPLTPAGEREPQASCLTFYDSGNRLYFADMSREQSMIPEIAQIDVKPGMEAGSRPA